MFPTPRKSRLFRFALTVALFASPISTGLRAQETSVLKVNSVTELDAVGNASVKATITAPTKLYTELKVRTPNVAVLLRQLGFGRGWSMFDNLDAKFNDMKSAIEISYTNRGFARVEHGSRWTIAVLKDANLDVVDIHDRVAIYQVAASSPIGVVNMIERVITPLGSKNLKNNPAANSFTYDFAPNLAAGGNADAAFNVDSKDAVMSCLAKCYGNEKFSALWVARSRFENSGTTVLDDYRVRFRIDGYSAWSTWRHAAKVFPGQTVVDPFFPVFDLDKLAVLTGTRAANLEFEYQYRRPDGRVVTETDSKKLQILGYNETIFSGLPRGEMMNFADATEYLPAVLASFTTPNDPAIEQLVGRVSGLVPHGLNNAAGSNENAIAFARAMYEFLVNNHLAYQTPPSYVNGNVYGQHIKYGRDVLRNHAGTCVDLAILWASACEAVQLEPVLVLIPGHCFPVIKLPKGGFLPVEATAIVGLDFEGAVKRGQQELQEVKAGQVTFIDILKMRRGGIQPIDLPRVSDTYLTDLGYDFSVRHQAASERKYAQTEPATETASTPTVVGTWTGTGRNQSGTSIRAGLVLQADGRMAYVVIVQYANGQSQRVEGSGRWEIEGNTLVLTDQYGPANCPFRANADQLSIYLAKINVQVHLVRSQG